MNAAEWNGANGWIASGPAFAPRARPGAAGVGATGWASVELAPARHISSLLKLAQPGHAVSAGSPFRDPLRDTADHVERSAQGHTARNASPVARQRVRTPCCQRGSVVGSGSGVPLAAICHSALVGSRLFRVGARLLGGTHVTNAAGPPTGCSRGRWSACAVWTAVRAGAVVVRRPSQLRRTARREICDQSPSRCRIFATRFAFAVVRARGRATHSPP